MSKKQISATIKLTTAMHIGGGKGNGAADAVLRRNSAGQIFIPGRAIGGALRTVATRLAVYLSSPNDINTVCDSLERGSNNEKQSSPQPCGCLVCNLFGDLYPSDPDGIGNNHGQPAVISRASRLWVYDAKMLEDTRPTHVRDGVGLKRQHGAARDHVKFSYEVVPAETAFALTIEVEPAKKPIYTNDSAEPSAWDADPDMDALTEALLAAAIAEWAAGRGQIGGNSSRGLGRFALEQITYMQNPIRDNQTLLAYLRGEQLDADHWEPELPTWRTAKNADIDPASDWVTIDYTLRFQDLYLSHDPVMGLLSGFDHAPLIEFVPGDLNQIGRPIISGSSIRGALRSQAGRIARTLTTLLAEQQPDPEAYFKAHCPMCDVLAVKDTDGHRPALNSCDDRLDPQDGDGDAVSGISRNVETPRGALCLGCQLFGSQRRGSRLWVRDAHWAKSSELGNGDWLAQDFLAIDRFTGGGLDGAKFDAAALQQAEFRGQIMLHNPSDWELGWLTLLLRDLADGRITVGFGAAKGYGRLTLEDCQWTIATLPFSDVPVVDWHGIDWQSGREDGIYVVQCEMADNGWAPDAFIAAAQGWVDQFNGQIKSFNHQDLAWAAVCPADPVRPTEDQILADLEIDSYFGTNSESLYGGSRSTITGGLK